MKEKKTEVITFRTSSDIRKRLEEEADLRGWSVAKLAETIISNYAKNTQIPDSIGQINIIHIQGG